MDSQLGVLKVLTFADDLVVDAAGVAMQPRRPRGTGRQPVQEFGEAQVESA